MVAIVIHFYYLMDRGVVKYIYLHLQMKTLLTHIRLCRSATLISTVTAHFLLSILSVEAELRKLTCERLMIFDEGIKLMSTFLSWTLLTFELPESYGVQVGGSCLALLL